ncbi:acetylserotonin O-methyltransferase-like [Eubalaena glacialis]|uniref:acetylserotonin O-methyltransferase-like n=1 Tax=Eubalaena glacialis TaxID=27606 RepID=UPI002A5A2E87|nr:acetylserotonin O-methyltransferase-like [Eubalaena glacialis]
MAGVACSETRDSRSQDDWGPPSQAGLEGRWVPPGEEGYRLLKEYSSAFMVSQVLFAACELGVFDLLAEAPEALGSAAVAARLGVSSRGTELLLDACVSLKLLQVEVRREKAVYESTELASTHLARASPKSQQDMLLYTARTPYLCWGHLAAAGRDGKNQYLKAFGVPSEELFTAIYRSRQVQGERLQAVRGLQDEWRLGGPRVVAAFDLSPFPRICDLGGGSGALAKACMSLYPGSQVTVFDIPDVVQMAKRHFSFPEDERIGFCEGDFFKDRLPEPDLCILARVLHDWTDEKCSHLLGRTYQACKTEDYGHSWGKDLGKKTGVCVDAVGIRTQGPSGRSGSSRNPRSFPSDAGARSILRPSERAPPRLSLRGGVALGGAGRLPRGTSHVTRGGVPRAPGSGNPSARGESDAPQAPRGRKLRRSGPSRASPSTALSGCWSLSATRVTAGFASSFPTEFAMWCAVSDAASSRMCVLGVSSILILVQDFKQEETITLAGF